MAPRKDAAISRETQFSMPNDKIRIVGVAAGDGCGGISIVVRTAVIALANFGSQVFAHDPQVRVKTAVARIDMYCCGVPQSELVQMFPRHGTNLADCSLRVASNSSITANVSARWRWRHDCRGTMAYGAVAIDAVAPLLASVAFAISALPTDALPAIKESTICSGLAGRMARALLFGDGAQGGPAGTVVTFAHVVPSTLSSVVAVRAIALETAVRSVIARITRTHPLPFAEQHTRTVVAVGVVEAVSLAGKDRQQYCAGNSLFSGATRISAA